MFLSTVCGDGAQAVVGSKRYCCTIDIVVDDTYAFGGFANFVDHRLINDLVANPLFKSLGDLVHAAHRLHQGALLIDVLVEIQKHLSKVARQQFAKGYGIDRCIAVYVAIDIHARVACPVAAGILVIAAQWAILS